MRPGYSVWGFILKITAEHTSVGDERMKENTINILMHTVLASPFLHVKAWERRLVRVLCVRETDRQESTIIVWLCSRNWGDIFPQFSCELPSGKVGQHGEIDFNCLRERSDPSWWKMAISDSVTSDEVCCYLVLLALLNKAVFIVNVNYTFFIRYFKIFITRKKMYYSSKVWLVSFFCLVFLAAVIWSKIV